MTEKSKSKFSSRLEDLEKNMSSPEEDNVNNPNKKEKEEVDASKKKLSRKDRKRLEAQLKKNFSAYPHLLFLKPKERIIFHSDYFEIDNYVGCILGFFHDEAAQDRFPAFWGVYKFARNLPDGVTISVLEQVDKMTDSWVQNKLKSSEKLDKMDANEQNDGGTKSTKQKSNKVSQDLDTIIYELQSLGCSYLNVHNRIFVKAPDLQTLEDVLDDIKHWYEEDLQNLRIAPYEGEQRRELSSLWLSNRRKRGKGDYYTSAEYAGSYGLVTNGLNDHGGTYVGSMVGDVNSSAVLFDVDNYDKYVVVADGTKSKSLDGQFLSNMWASKLSQSCLKNNRRVVHLILDECDLDLLGPKFDTLTSHVDMDRGDVNPFEIFGISGDETVLFQQHLSKLVLMTFQASPPVESERTLLAGALQQSLTDFYVDKKMWYKNAVDNIGRLRLVNLYHDQVPTLAQFAMYLEQAYTREKNDGGNDQDMLQAYSKLRLIFMNLLNNNGDLFNVVTSDKFDNIRNSRRVLYRFSDIMRRDHGLAMAQLVNIVGFAVGQLGEGDLVILHGTEHLVDAVKPYLSRQFQSLIVKGGRVAYVYNDVDAMLKDNSFNKYDDADYTLIGTMRDSSIKLYQEKLGQLIPGELATLITKKHTNFTYLRRNITNVVFSTDLPLGINAEKLARKGKVPEYLRRRQSKLDREVSVKNSIQTSQSGKMSKSQNQSSSHDDRITKSRTLRGRPASKKLL